jgi:ribonuclease D
MKKNAPTKAEIALLAPFEGLSLENIVVPTNFEEFTRASSDIKSAAIVGFDTESKPTFVSGEFSDGPHVVQFALHDKAYLFQLHYSEAIPFLLELLQSDQVIKIGFGLKSDARQILSKLGVRLSGVIDLNTIFSMDGYRKEMGVRSAVGLVLNQRFIKSRLVTTSNWSLNKLSQKQMLYAANDAYAAFKVFKALGFSLDKLPNMKLSNLSSDEQISKVRSFWTNPIPKE